MPNNAIVQKGRELARAYLQRRAGPEALASSIETAALAGRNALWSFADELHEAITTDTTSKPELFAIENGGPLFDSGNVIDGATELHRYALFILQRYAEDEDELELKTALSVLTHGTGSLRDALYAYDRALNDWRGSIARAASADHPPGATSERAGSAAAIALWLEVERLNDGLEYREHEDETRKVMTDTLDGYVRADEAGRRGFVTMLADLLATVHGSGTPNAVRWQTPPTRNTGRAGITPAMSDAERDALAVQWKGGAQ